MKNIYSALLIFFCAVGAAGAQTYSEESVSAYREIMRISAPSIMVPTVVEVPLVYTSDRRSVMVADNQTGFMVPSYLHEAYTTTPATVSASVVINGEVSTGWVMTDNNSETGLEFLLPEDRRGLATITLTTSEPVTASAFSFDFSKNVLFAATVEVRAVVDGQMRIVLSEVPLMKERVDFIPTFSDTWIVTLKYAQPLAVNEIYLFQDDVERSVTRGVRFLAQPGTSYTLYHNPDRSVSIPYMEQGNLYDSEGVLMVSGVGTEMNPRFVPSDGDSDGVLDAEDNCVSLPNSDQVDIDSNGRGDACDDYDRDGLVNSKDNCPNLPNMGQADEDGDGIGDVCDGEESRFTERYTWVPWVGMGVAGLVLVVLFSLVARRPVKPCSD